jgi:hypothetical protein
MSYGDVLVQMIEKQTQRGVFLDNKIQVRFLVVPTKELE